MRDGRSRRKLTVKIILSGLCLYLMVNLGLFWREYREYQEKMELLCLAAEDGGSQISHVTGYLKGEYRPSVRSGRKRLEALGYSEAYMDTLKKQLVRGTKENLLLTAAACTAAVACVLLMLRRLGREESQELRNMCDAVEAVRAGEDTGKLFWAGETAEQDDFYRLRMELISLAEQTGLAVERAGEEKEHTKALVTDLSHQIRTPLSALRISFDILADDSSAGASEKRAAENRCRRYLEDKGEFLDRCRDQIDHLEELVASMLQISRMESGLIELKLKDVPLFDTLLSAVSRIYPRADSKGIETVLEESAAGDEHQMIRQDAHWLSEALINILENAVKYSPEGTSIRIRVQRMTMYLRIEIEDQGIGIPAEERNLIWQRFYRGKGREVQKEKGQGIGLYLTRMIIEKHGGTIRVEPVTGAAGSRFLIHLPVKCA